MSPPSPSKAALPRRAHVVLVSSAGMGHLIPLSRLAAALAASGVADISVVSFLPTVSAAEQHLLAGLSSHGVNVVEAHLHDVSGKDSAGDPFNLRFDAIRRSAGQLLPPLLAAAATTVTTLVADITVVSSLAPVAAELGVPCFVLFTSSAAMLSLCAYYNTHIANKSTTSGGVDIPGVDKIESSSLPPPLRDPEHIFTAGFVDNGRHLAGAAGVILNSFDFLERDAITALNSGKVLPGFPPVFAVGPLKPMKSPSSVSSPAMEWLDSQPAKSVVYVSFGSRTTMSAAQIEQLGIGLEASGCRFLWVVKSAKVDRDDEAAAGDIVGDPAFLERVKHRGMVFKGWVEQDRVLEHAAIGCFLSHCGWNSVTEAALNGVPTLAWPRAGDQRVNAGAVARSGLGVWEKEWPWEAEEGVVSGEEIGKKVKEVMEDAGVKATAASVGAAARAAVADCGRSSRALLALVEALRSSA